MTPFILQPFGLGDCIFIQTLVWELSEGRRTLWPVKEHFMQGLQRAYPSITWIPVGGVETEVMEMKVKQAPVGDCYVYGIRFAEYLMKRQYKDHMKSKYDLYGFDWKDWKRRAYPVRNAEREKQLLEILGITDEPFNLIATKFGSDATFEIKINLHNEYKNVYMNVVPGFSLFDWCAVIERAATIHAVSSSTLYLFEILALQATQVHLYPRKPIERDFTYTKFLFSKNYILHD